MLVVISLGLSIPQLVPINRWSSLVFPGPGEMVSACVSTSGAAFLWGCGTNAQLGNGSRRTGTKAIGLQDSETDSRGDDNLDEVVPWRLDSSLLQNHEILKVEYGGQHTLLLAKPH